MSIWKLEFSGKENAAKASEALVNMRSVQLGSVVVVELTDVEYTNAVANVVSEFGGYISNDEPTAYDLEQLSFDRKTIITNEDERWLTVE